MAAAAHLEIHRTWNREHLHHYVAGYGDKKENCRLYLKEKQNKCALPYIYTYNVNSVLHKTILFVGTARLIIALKIIITHPGGLDK